MAEKQKVSMMVEVFNFSKSVGFLVLIAFMIRATIVEPFKIPSSSMEPTLLIGDHLFVNKLSYGLRFLGFKKILWQWDQPERGDIVVFTLPDDPATPEDESDTNIIKRVIGLPGDRIEVRGTTVYINGAPFSDDDKWAHWLRGGLKDFPAVADEYGNEIRVPPGKYVATVPPGRVFLMGDNRDFSRDARFWPDHFLEQSRIKGRAFIIYWSSAYNFSRMFSIIR